ncbi:MAG: hypothetical protein ACTSXD_08505 [Candidatus Heimdallarchaeaceae archaeon]
MTVSYPMVKVELYKRTGDNEWTPSAIELTEVYDVETRVGLAERLDSFSFRMLNRDQICYVEKLQGDGSTTSFNLEYSPIPNKNPQYETVKIDADGDWKFEQILDPNEYTLTASGITFSSAPPSAINDYNVIINRPLISVNDNIKIYRWKDSPSAPSIPDFDGLVETITNDLDEFGGAITVKGKEWGESVYDNIVPVDAPSNTAWNVIHIALQNIRRFQPNRPIYFRGCDHDMGTYCNNPSCDRFSDYVSQDLASAYNCYGSLFGGTGATGSEFDAISSIDQTYESIAYVKDNTPCYRIVEDMSSDKFTLNGAYYSYSTRYEDTGNPSSTGDTYTFLVWKKKDTTIDNNIIEGIDFEVAKDERKVDDVINLIYYDSGTDCYDHGIKYINYNLTSISKYGVKSTYEKFPEDIGQTLIIKERLENTSKFPSDSEGRFTSPFPNPSEYPYTFITILSRDPGTHKIVGPSETANNDGEYNFVIRDEARWRGYNEAYSILDSFGEPRVFLDTTMPFNEDFIKGEVVDVNIQSSGLPETASSLQNLPLRIVEINQKFWSTTLRMEQDEESIGGT